MSDLKESKSDSKVILVIEDELPLIRAIRDKLTKYGFEVISARAVKQALELMQEVENISAVWLDHYLLGSEDGLDYVKQLKNNERWKNIPIFVVSNTASSSKVENYHKLGITKFFTKANFRLDEIIGEIQQCIGK